jgi:hypothetical protein
MRRDLLDRFAPPVICETRSIETHETSVILFQWLRNSGCCPKLREAISRCLYSRYKQLDHDEQAEDLIGRPPLANTPSEFLERSENGTKERESGRERRKMRER